MHPRDLASLAGEETIFGGFAAEKLTRLQSELEPLSRRYDVVVANPPYMGSKNMNKWLGDWVKTHYKDVKGDLFSCFMVRNVGMGAEHAQLGFMTPYVWMFIGTYEKLRKFVIRQNTITSLIQLEYSGFSGATVPICTFTLQKGYCPGYRGGYVRLSDFVGADQQAPRALESLANPDCGWFYRADASSFEAIPGSPIAYWLKGTLIEAFRNERTLIKNVDLTASGNKTADNDLYIRYWYEVAHTSKRWVPLSKGGEFRKWYGNWLNVIDWSAEAKHFYQTNKTSNLMPYSNWFVEGITWSDISSGKFHCRYAPSSVTSETVDPIFAISNHVKRNCTMALLNSSFADVVFELLAPGLHFKINDIGKLPFNEAATNNSTLSSIVDDNINLARIDWNAFEVSCGFKRHPLA